MKGNKTILLLLAAGAAYWYYAVYLRNRTKGLPNYNDVIQASNNASNVPERVPVDARLQPTGYNPNIVEGEFDYTQYQPTIFDRNVQKYTIRGFKKLGKVPNTI